VNLVSGIYASVLALWILGLGFWVTRVRHSERIDLGLGSSDAMERSVRIHANAVENVPLAMILLFFAELSGTSAPIIHAIGGGVVLGRVLHFLGLRSSRGVSFGRWWGTAITWTSMASAAVLTLLAHLGWTV